MPEKVEVRRNRVKTFASDQSENVEVKDVVEKRPTPIYLGTATCNLYEAGLAAGDEIKVLEDKGDEWLTEKGLVSKLYLLLKNTN